MKTLVIYDNTGKIYAMIHGADQPPQGLQSMYVDLPGGAILERIDVTDPDNPQPVFKQLPDSDIGRLQTRTTELETELTATQLAVAEQYESNLELQDQLTNTQLALTEIFEGMGV